VVVTSTRAIPALLSFEIIDSLLIKTCIELFLFLNKFFSCINLNLFQRNKEENYSTIAGSEKHAMLD